VQLTNAANSVAAATISNGNRAVSFVNALALTLGGLTMGTGSLTVGGALTQTGPISGSSLSITSSTGSIDLRNSANGLLLDSRASGSVIRNIAFSSFSGDAIRLTSATGITIKGIQANNSGNGLSITGASTNTVV